MLISGLICVLCWVIRGDVIVNILVFCGWLCWGFNVGIVDICVGGELYIL